MLIYPDINPVAFTIFNFPIYWYGISYLAGLMSCYLLLLKAAPASSSNALAKNPWNKDLISDVIFYAAVGIILGGRIGFVLFYFPQDILTKPLSMFYFFAPGRSFHGGFIGVLLAMYWFAKKNDLRFLQLTDFIAPVVPIGLAFGRLGNFMNGELWGRVASGELPWAMVFPLVDGNPRHPSQIYQFFCEGIVLFVILQLLKNKLTGRGKMSAAFCLGYAFMRILTEFFREPDLSHGFMLGNWLTMGHMLSVPLIIVGVYLLVKPEQA
jgi:phosphatidylglycerol:prolipoprotein diacylglycerol transferase